MIRTYIAEALIPGLRMNGVPDRQATMVASDVEIRLRAILSRWNDVSFRRTLLTLGHEEAANHKPANVDLDIRSLVVVAIRNSALEEICSTQEAAEAYGLPHPIPLDAHMLKITRAASRYFARFDLQKEARKVDPPHNDEDPFAALPIKYPATWAAFEALASNPGIETRYPARPTGSVLSISDVDSPEAPPTHAKSSDIMSGMDPRLGQSLREALRDHVINQVPEFYTPSFKHLTRHPGKLMGVLEFLFHHGIAFVTNNYYLSNGHVIQRNPLLRPIHKQSELAGAIAEAVTNAVGVHRESLLRSMRRMMMIL